jgi:CPA2 family monovalent cation:H+ antiporter-2
VEPHGTDLVATIAIALGAAFVAGYLARLIGLPAIVGYLLAGVAVGPFTPGFVADLVQRCSWPKSAWRC